MKKGRGLKFQTKLNRTIKKFTLSRDTHTQFETSVRSWVTQNRKKKDFQLYFFNYEDGC